jgi:hypothetical protein
MDINRKDQIHISKVDRFMSLAATMGVETMRSSDFTGFTINEDYTIIPREGGEKLAEVAAEKGPDSFEANIMKLGMVAMSPVAALETMDTPEGFDGVEGCNFLNSELSIQVYGILDQQITQYMFSKPSLRYRIAEVMKLRTNPEALGEKMESPEHMKAFKEFHEIVKGIREAEMKGEKTFVSPFNSDFELEINLEMVEGVYKRCTNYTVSIKETFKPRYRKLTTTPDYSGFAAYGTSTATAIEAGSEAESMAYKVGAGLQIGVPPPPPPPPPPPEKAPAGPGGKVEGVTGSDFGKVEPPKTGFEYGKVDEGSGSGGEG